MNFFRRRNCTDYPAFTPVAPGSGATPPPARPQQPQQPQPAEKAPAPRAEAKQDGRIRLSLTQPDCRFSDLIFAPAVTRRIQALLCRIRHHRTLYEEWNLQKIDPQGKHVAVNFYGPSGTGKTRAAYALAAELGKPIIEVSYAELESKYVGVTSQNIEAAFAAAREHDAVLFFDEADSLLGKRLSRVTQASDHAVNTSRSVMLKQLDAFDGVVVFASNLVQSFDRAFVRRILEHIELPLPDTATRTLLWQRFITPRITGRDALDWSALAAASDGFSGGLILDAVKLACARAVTTAAADTAPVLLQEHLLSAVSQIASARQVIGTNGSGANV